MLRGTFFILFISHLHVVAGSGGVEVEVKVEVDIKAEVELDAEVEEEVEEEEG